MRKLHGVILSPFVRKIRVALEEKGLAYETVPVVPFGVSADFKKISPAGKIPVYEDEDGFTVPDSSVILDYLEQRHPEPPLYPADTRERAKALFLEEYGDTVLMEACGPLFFEHYVAVRHLHRETDEAVVRHCQQELQPAVFEYVQSVVAGREFAVGTHLSVADLGLVSPLIQLSLVDAAVDAGRWPHLAAYLDGILARPSLRKLLAEDRAEL